MDENKKHCVLKYLGIVLATLIGAFLAFYFAVHSMLDRITNPCNIMHRAEKMMRDFDGFDKDFSVPKGPHKHFHDHGVISFMRTPDAYKFIIDLKPFRGNANAVRVETKGQQITISGETTSNKKNNEYFTRITQSYLLDDDAKIDKMSKKIVSDRYIITIPAED